MGPQTRVLPVCYYPCTRIKSSVKSLIRLSKGIYSSCKLYAWSASFVSDNELSLFFSVISIYRRIAQSIAQYYYFISGSAICLYQSITREYRKLWMAAESLTGTVRFRFQDRYRYSPMVFFFQMIIDFWMIFEGISIVRVEISTAGKVLFQAIYVLTVSMYRFANVYSLPWRYNLHGWR